MDRADHSVLILDDDDIVAEAIADGVRLAGYSVCGIATDANRALELAREHQPKLAVVDVNLGDGEDGKDAARRMTAMGPVGVVFVTGYPDRLRHADVGLAWIEKPYRVLDLINALDAAAALREDRPVTGRMPPEVHLIR